VSATAQPGPAPAVTAARGRRIGVAVIGFGWLGQAHSRSMLRIPTLFEDRSFDPSSSSSPALSWWYCSGARLW
jgi:hypothetical protein